MGGTGRGWANLQYWLSFAYGFVIINGLIYSSNRAIFSNYIPVQLTIFQI